MTEKESRELCLALMKADSENEVIQLLQAAGYWDLPALWRYFGDYEGNFNTIGNQQSRPDAALVEKAVNAEDARLMNECLARGIDPEGLSAPQDIRRAVAVFFDEKLPPDSEFAGRIHYWTNSKRTDIAQGITIAATGAPPREGKPCFTISDSGEGQTPDMIPETLCSLNKSNKLRIPFVQGKFNMGGTGVLKFCGRHNLQLILSRRNPSILSAKSKNASDEMWGFTVVRREDPIGGSRSSVYTYLAPVDLGKASRRGGVLRFKSETLPIFPEGREAYFKRARWGTLIKLYEYAAAGYSNTHILRKDGLLGRIDLLLPDPALPIRLYECRQAFRGHEGSFETTLTGLTVRLEDDKGENLEEGFPSSCPISVEGERLTATIYAFKKGRAETYRKHEGVVFTLNGQTHGHLTKDFFNRKDAGRLNYIADSILVIVDCSAISGRAREDLFMNSRDRLSHGELRMDLEEKLEDMLRHHTGLRALKDKRRNEEIQCKLEDEKPLEEILSSLLQHSPTLSALFLQGKRASNPFKTIHVQEMETEFKGKKHPTYFKFKDKEYGKELRRDCQINHRSRITFETDAVNDYFSRISDQGEFSLLLLSDEGRTAVSDYVGPNLQNGIGTLAVQLPVTCKIGDQLKFEAIVNDPTRLNPFSNIFLLEVKPEAIINGGGGRRRKPPSDDLGEGRETPAGISLPNIRLVHESEWEAQNPPFDKYTALRVRISDEPVTDGENSTAESHDVYDFSINMDNLFLKSELKTSREDVEITNARWKYGLVLVGLALLHDEAQKPKAGQAAEVDDEGENGDDVETRIESFSKAIAPVLLPMINSLGALELEAAVSASSSGEAT